MAERRRLNKENHEVTDMLNKLERKFGKYAIPHLIVWLIGGYALGYLLQIGGTITNVNFIQFMTLEPY